MLSPTHPRPAHIPGTVLQVCQAAETSPTCAGTGSLYLAGDVLKHLDADSVLNL